MTHTSSTSDACQFLLNTLYTNKEQAGGLLNADIAATRENVQAQSAVLPVPVEVDITVKTIAGVRCEVHTPQNADNTKALLYFHGGGFVICGPDTHRNITLRTAKILGIPCISVDYRMAPEHPFPAAIDDCFAVFQSLCEELGASNIVLGGDSAGGNLVVNVALKARDAALEQPAALWMLSPWCDLEGTNFPEDIAALEEKDPTLTAASLHNYAQHYLGTADTSPFYGSVFASSDFSGLAKSLIQVGDLEILQNDAITLHQKLSDARSQSQLSIGHGLWHVWQIYAGMMPEADAAIEEGALFLQNALTPHSH